VIQGYPDNVSAFPRDTINFHVATDAPQFCIAFYRQGQTLIDTGVVTAWFIGAPGENHDAGQDFGEDATREDGQAVAGWAAYPFQIPDWSTGVYIAMFIEGDGADNPNPVQQPPLDVSTPDARTGKALIVVKNPAPGYDSQLLYKLPLFTYQMYNMTFYQGVDGQMHAAAGYGFTNYFTGQPAYAGPVTMRRPGGGTGGTPWDSVFFGPIGANGVQTGNLDPFDPTLRQTFVHWDAKMIAWLEGEGYRVDYCTDMDIHNDTDGTLLRAYALVLSVGHDEYYSTNMRDHLEAFIAAGGNIAFFSGNTCYYYLYFPTTDASGDPDPRFISRNDTWVNNGRPEDSLTGVGFRNGGERNYPAPDNNQKVGYTVQNTDLWPFENTGLADGDTFGRDLSIVGYECDGTPYDHAAAKPVSPSFVAGNNTPQGLQILGTGVVASWGGNQAGSATMAMYTNSGTAFTGATTDWPRLLASGDAATQMITRNVIDRLGGDPKGVADLADAENVIACDGFFSAGDGIRHAVFATIEGAISELRYTPDGGISTGMSITLDGVVDIAGFASDDQMRHVIAIDSDGSVWDITWADLAPPVISLARNIAGAVCVAGFYTPDDSCCHAIVGTRTGDVFEVYYQGDPGPLSPRVMLNSFSDVVDVGGFYSPDDGYRHAIVATGDGRVSEIYYGQFGVSQTPIAWIPDLTRLSAYYADGDAFFARRVQVLTSGAQVHEVRYDPRFGVLRAVLTNPGPLIDLGGFYSADDGFCHAIFAPTHGGIEELYMDAS
jgi:hypothetical protein